MVNGSLNLFTPPGTSPKTSWSNASQTTANTNPLQLDSNGCAVIFGVGSYREQLFDGPVVGGIVTGNLIFDLTTTDTSAYNSTFWAATAGGTPNVITVTDTGFNATDGTIINFLALSTNTGATTLNPSGFGAINIEKATTGGLTSLTGGEIVAGNPISVIYSSSNNAFILLNTAIPSASGVALPLCGASNFKLVVTTNSALTLNAGSLTTTAPTGLIYNRSAVALTVNATTVGANGLSADVGGGALGANTWYYVWAIDNGSAAAGLISSSSTAPTLPSGYTTQCRVGAIITDGSDNLYRVEQLGSRAQYKVVAATNTPGLIVVVTGTAGSISTPTWVSVSPQIPPTAAIADLIINNSSGSGSEAILVAPSNAYGAVSSVTNPPPCSDVNNAATTTDRQCSLNLETAQTIFWASNAAGGIYVRGWVDQVNAN
jgi:hypothetical protein